jgi:hypothetical protein
MSFIRLMIVNARDAQAQYMIERDFCEARDYLADKAGCQSSQVLSQDDGLMVAFLTVWASREDALQFHESGLNNLVTTVTDRHITGRPVIWLLRIIC